MSIRIDALTIDSPDPDNLAHFYEALLGWQRTYDDDGEILIEDPEGTSTAILFLQGDDEKVTKNRLHLDLRPDDQDEAVQRALAYGASHTDIGQHDDPDVTWVVLADPDGNEFCILADRDEPTVADVDTDRDDATDDDDSADSDSSHVPQSDAGT